MLQMSDYISASNRLVHGYRLLEIGSYSPDGKDGWAFSVTFFLYTERDEFQKEDHYYPAPLLLRGGRNIEIL